MEYQKDHLPSLKLNKFELKEIYRILFQYYLF